jgi:PAS domain S-box-containing protein
MALIGPDGHHVQVNRAYCELVRQTEDELIGRGVLDFVHDDDREWLIEEYAALADGLTDHATLELRSGEHVGTVRWYRVHRVARSAISSRTSRTSPNVISRSPSCA